MYKCVCVCAHTRVQTCVYMKLKSQKKTPYHGAPFPQAPVTQDHQWHQLYLENTQVMARQPAEIH
jgi:hypothetical protein